MKHNIYRETWAEIDLDAIGYNLKQMKQKLPQHCNIIAVVKANGYGHGAVQIARKALQSGAVALAVALLEEALILREAGIVAPILVFGRISPEAAAVAAEQDITVSLYQSEWIQEVNHQTLPQDLKVHLVLDTGMARVGLRTEEELTELLDKLKQSSNIKLTGIFTHFATADEADLTYFRKQQSRLEQLLEVLHSQWPEPVAVHTGNSAASIRFPKEMQHYIRFGVSMYGLYPSKVVKAEQTISLKPAFSLHSKLIHTKQIDPGYSVSYGATFTAEEQEWIGTIPIGYGDGWIRKIQGLEVLVDGKRMPIVGRICMDMMMVRLDREYPVGTKVTLIGKQKDAVIEMDDLADHLDTINYEIPCMINGRVPRVYKGE